MLGWGKAGTVDASATVSLSRCQEIYQRYAVSLYRQALLNLDDSASAEDVVCDPVVNECALALMPEHGEDDARYDLAELVFGRSRQLAVGLAVLGIHPREMAALWRAVLRKLTTSPPAAAEDGDQE